MGDETVRMPFDDVRKHAGSVDHASSGADLARSAAAQVQLGNEAYGLLCQFVPALIDAVANSAVNAFSASAAALTETAGKLRTAAGGHEATDHGAGTRVSGTGRHLKLPL
ncbi:type VII secretion target [Micromonospora sp. NPDC049559]|uniref:type VII secretion target n=1 Tax=Micromonospora sp. NPDC049559 TaxID=3155923 RepID=UPI00344759B1